MPSDEELRAALRRLANDAPTGDATDLQTARRRGQTRLRNRRVAVAAALVAALIGAGALFAAMGDDDPLVQAGPPSTTVSPTTVSPTTVSPTTESPTTTSSSTTTPTTTWSPPADDPTQPAPAAVAADQAFRVAPDGFLDCGVHVRTSGYPTTVVARPDILDCILDAADSGTPAQFVTTARDFRGGMEGIIFRVTGPSDIVVIPYTALPDGELVIGEEYCTGLHVPNFPIPECT